MSQHSALNLDVIIGFSGKIYRTLSDTFGHFRIFCLNQQRLKEMNLVKLFEILNNNRAKEPSDYAFFMKLIDVFVKPKDEDSDANRNPFESLDQDTVERYFRGQRSFSKNRLADTKRLRNIQSFASFVNSYFSSTQLENIELEIQREIPNFNENGGKINYLLANLFDEAIDESLQKKGSTSGDKSGIISSNYYYDHNDNRIHIGGSIIDLPPELTPPENIDDEEITYITELLKAYADASGTPALTIDEISKLSGTFKANFTEQRINYYSAVRICRIIRDAYANPEIEMKKWKTQTYDYISDTYRDDYDNGYKRLIAVLKKVVDCKTTAAIEGCDQFIQPKERKGVCHLLVNDGDIHWVQKDE